MKGATTMLQLRRLTWIVFLTAFLLYVFQLIDYINFSIDDTFISMRVARNVSDGYGFVYNVGENVEGFSNWLWVVLMTIPLKLGFFSGDHAMGLLWFAKGLSVVFSIFTLVALYRFIKRILMNDPYKEIIAISGVLVLISNGIFAAWSMSGMETTSWAFLLISAVSLLTQFNASEHSSRVTKDFLASFTLILMTLSRPEGIFLAIVLLFGCFLLTKTREEKREILFVSIPVLLTFIVFLVWRWNTYQELVPNTFFAKTGGGLLSYVKGIKYSIAGFGSICSLCLLFTPFAYIKLKEYHSLILLLFSLVASMIFVIIFSAGDWMPGFRFIVPVIPLLIVLTVIGIRGIYDRYFTGKNIPLSLVTLCLFVLLLGNVFANRALIRAQAPTIGGAFFSAAGHLLPSHLLVSNWLKEHSDSTTLFACGEAGIIGYENQHLRMIDLNGLMDKHIAHLRKEGKSFDVDYVLDKKPKFILLHYGKMDARERNPVVESTDYYEMIPQSSRFSREYQLVYSSSVFDVYARK